MHPLYCADPAIQTAIVGALDLHGLWPDPAAIGERPRCADRWDHQLRRIARSVAVLEIIRSRVRVDEPTRRLIERLVDSASESIECEESQVRPEKPTAEPPVTTPPPPMIRSSQLRRKAARA